ncbi:MAG: hypothetical protein H0X42_04990 [Solirubrobacterales bacterium]|nr:hypothetical protein [Solirubrobacterales bacterium]
MIASAIGQANGRIRNTFETTAGRTAACDRGRVWSSRSRTQGAALGGAKRKPEDAEMRSRHARHPGARGRAAGGLVPDAPVSKFVLEMQGGKKGLLVNSTNVCKHKNKAISHFVGQNGKVYDTTPVLKAQCGKARKKGKKASKHRSAHK